MGASTGTHRRSSLKLFAALSSAIFFALICWAVGAGATQRIDERVIVAMRIPGHPEDPRGKPWVEHLARDITSFGAAWPIVIMTVAVGAYLVMTKRKRDGCQLLVTVLSGMGFYSLMKHLVGRSRPELVSHLVYSTTPSFPSGHAMASVLFYLSLAWIVLGHKSQREVRVFGWTIAILWVVAIGLSRVYLGVHWPTDVVSGWAAGVAWILACHSIFQRTVIRN